MTIDPNRLGPIERAIHERDPEKLLEILFSRSDFDPVTGCRSWLGARREVGYGFVGRGRTLHLTHRLSAWAQAGMPGSVKDFPQVGHLCANKACLAHVQPVLAAANILESRVRNALVRRIHELEDALRELDPNHPKLEYVPITDSDAPIPIPTRQTYSSRELLRRQQRREQYQAKLDERASWRFEQVLDVRNRMAAGARMVDALRSVGISRRVFQDWEQRLTEWRERREVEGGSEHRPGRAA